MQKMNIVCLIGVLITAHAYSTESTKTWSEFSFILKPSTIPEAGVGVFATHDISAGTLLFRLERNVTRILKMKDIPTEHLKYCTYGDNGECIAPERFDRMEIGWYINHSSTPNVGRRSCPERNGEHRLYTIKDIKAGDEIVMDYNELGEPEDLKEDYYKNNPL